MKENESEMRMKSDLLYEEIALDYIKKIEDVKTYLIYAAAGEIETFDGTAILHLKNLNDLLVHLSDLADNAKNELIIFDYEKKS